MDFSLASREDKLVILREIINALPIRNEEKDLYFFSMDLLDNNDFEKFFNKIVNNFSENSKNTIQFIET